MRDREPTIDLSLNSERLQNHHARRFSDLEVPRRSSFPDDAACSSQYEFRFHESHSSTTFLEPCLEMTDEGIVHRPSFPPL
jgi:hypothetical protein